MIAKYVEALGGQQALQNAKTRVMTGTVTSRDQVVSPVTVQEKATGRVPHRHRDAADPDDSRVQRQGGVGDRRRRWRPRRSPPDVPRDLPGFQQQQGLRLADFTLPLGVKERYTSSPRQQGIRDRSTPNRSSSSPDASRRT